MATNRETRFHRILNVVIFAGVLAVVSAMMVTPRHGPEAFFGDWLTRGLPFLAIGLLAIAIGAPRYIRGRKS